MILRIIRFSHEVCDKGIHAYLNFLQTELWWVIE